MTKKMAVALEAAIQHHKDNRAAARKMQFDKISINSEDCALCLITRGDCSMCIINYGCYSTPYAELLKTHNRLEYRKSKENFSEFAYAETKEIKFLESLKGK